MSPVLFVLFFVVLHVCGSSEGQKNITAEPGQNVTLTCKDPGNHTVVLLEWSRDGTEPKTLIVIRDGRPYPAAQHESFRNQVSLKDSQMKDGDLSVVLKNVTMKDTGTYECRVGHENDPQESPLSLISSVDLSVVPPGEKGEQGGDGEKKDEGKEDGAGMSKGDIAGIVVGVLLLLLLLLAAVVLFWISKKTKNQHRDSPEPNEQQIPLRSQNRKLKHQHDLKTSMYREEYLQT